MADEENYAESIVSFHLSRVSFSFFSLSHSLWNWTNATAFFTKRTAGKTETRSTIRERICVFRIISKITSNRFECHWSLFISNIDIISSRLKRNKCAEEISKRESTTSSNLTVCTDLVLSRRNNGLAMKICWKYCFEYMVRCVRAPTIARCMEERRVKATSEFQNKAKCACNNHKGNNKKTWWVQISTINVWYVLEFSASSSVGSRFFLSRRRSSTKTNIAKIPICPLCSLSET